MRKLEVLNTNYEKSGLYAKIPALNDMTLKEFFEGLNIVKNYDSVRTFNNAIETVDESILIDSSISLISGHEYFSAFDLIFKTMPADAPDSYRLWVGSEGVTDTITHSFLTNEKEVFMNVKTAASSRTADLYLNLFGLTIGQSMSLETDLYFIIDLTNLSFEVTEEQVYYYYRMYRYLKDSKSFNGFTYLPKGQSKYDVAYVNQTIDDPIAELNGHTLREVFEDGMQVSNYDFDNGTTYWSLGTLVYATENNGVLEILANEADTRIQQQLFAANEAGHKVFRFADVKTTSNQVGIAETTTPLQYHPGNNEYYLLTGQQIEFRQGYVAIVDKRTTNYDPIFIKFIGAVNQTLLDIEQVSNVQMKYYLELYLARKNITKKQLTYADIFEEFNIWKTNYTPSITVLDKGDYFEVSTTAPNSPRIIVDPEPPSGEQFYLHTQIKNIAPEATNIRIVFYDRNPVFYQTDIILNQWYEYSLVTSRLTDSGGLDIAMPYWYGSSYNLGILAHTKNNIVLSFKHFDESITKEQLDTMLDHYLLVKNIIIYPEIYVPIEPVGLGNRFKLLAVDDTVYGHELDFEDISFKMYFGVNFDAYKGYHAMMNMLRSNKAIIEYDWGIGPRYNDVRLLNAPKTEKDTSLLIISKFYFKRLNPFYELIEVSDEEDIKNESDLDSPVKLDLTVSNTTVSIKLLDASSGVQQEISFDFSGVSTPFNLTIDPETKKLLIDDITDAYDYADHSKESFIYLPGDSKIYSLNITGADVNKITYKKWVIS